MVADVVDGKMRCHVAMYTHATWCTHMFVRMCVHVCARVHACMCPRARAYVRTCAHL